MTPPIVDRAWLREHSGVVLADVRHYLDGRSGRAAYESGHLPGAVFVDLDAQLAAHDAAPGLGRHPLPDPDAFAAAMSSLGIGDADVVVAYDDQGGIMAARLVWMLRATAMPPRCSTAGSRPPTLRSRSTPRRGRPRGSPRDPSPASPRSTTPPTRRTSSSTPASASASTVRPTRSTSAPAISPAPAASRVARTWPPTAACSSRRAARQAARGRHRRRVARSSPTAAQASPPATTCS